MLKFKIRFSLRILFWAFTMVAVLIGAAVCFVASLSRMPEGIELVTEISPSPSGDDIAFAAYHGGLQSWNGVRDFIFKYTGHNAYPESVRWMLLNPSNAKLRDLGPGELAGECIAWRNDESIIAYVTNALQLTDPRKRLQLYEASKGTAETAYVSSDWYLQTLRFSPDGKSLAFIENYDAKNLTVLDVASRNKVVLASRVSSHELLWSQDGATIFYVRDGLDIWQINVNTRSSKRIFRGQDRDENCPNFLVLSPDGKLLGFDYGPGFHVLDLATHKVENWFDCEHYFLTFDWTNDGICYLDAAGEELRNKARVMVYDPRTKVATEMAIGRYGHVAWLRDDVLILGKNRTELWELNIKTKATKRIFPSSVD